MRIGFGEYCAQIAAGLPMSAHEVVRPSTFGLDDAARTFAAQLHQRLLWLRELAECESGDRQPR